jgi:phosphoribosylglycinamide formyltransferase-1
MPLKVLLLASGSGTLAQAIFDAFPKENPSVEIIGLISDQNCKAMERAALYGIPTFLIEMRENRAEWNKLILEQSSQLNPDLVVSVGFMRILAAEYVAKFSVINTHPALLPLFPGAHAVRDALAAGAVETGSTVHWVDAGVDTGKVISQSAILIEPGESESELHERIKIVERKLIVEVIQEFATNGFGGNRAGKK